MRHFLAAAAAATDVGQLWDALTAYFAGHGIHDIAILHFPLPGSSDPASSWSMLSGSPEEWSCLYITDGLMLHDPIRAQAAVSPLPFKWSDIRNLRSITPEEENFLDKLARLHRKDGLVIPVFGPSGRNGYFTFALPEDFDLPSYLIVEFRVVAQYAHQCSCELVAARSQGTAPLSPREQEVLVWLARGKSNSVIADIIGVSANTVDTHVRRIFVKLQVSDRVSAAITAMGQGLISLE